MLFPIGTHLSTPVHPCKTVKEPRLDLCMHRLIALLSSPSHSSPTRRYRLNSAPVLTQITRPSSHRFGTRRARRGGSPAHPGCLFPTPEATVYCIWHRLRKTRHHSPISADCRSTALSRLASLPPHVRCSTGPLIALLLPLKLACVILPRHGAHGDERWRRCKSLEMHQSTDVGGMLLELYSHTV